MKLSTISMLAGSALLGLVAACTSADTHGPNVNVGPGGSITGGSARGPDIQVRDNAVGAAPGASASAGGGQRSERTLADRWREEQ